MRFATLALVVLTLVQPPIQTGTASQYAAGVMSRVIQYRQAHHQIPADLSAYDGYAAGRYPDEIGTAVWVRPVGAARWELILIVDCAGIADGGLAWMLRGNVLLEVDHTTAQRWHTVGRGIQVEVMRSSIGYDNTLHEP